MFEQTKYSARYYNSNGYAMVVVAVVNHDDEELFDWTAYMNGCSADISKREAWEWVAEYGCKLSRSDAAHFFPTLNIDHYRE